MKHTSVLGLAIAAAIVSASASGAEPGAPLQYGARLGAIYSDNVERVPTNEESSGAAVVGFDIRALREAGRLRYDVLGDMEYREYFKSGVEGQTYGRLAADSSYGIVPETFDWFLSGSFDQVREDILSPAAPSNLEDVITLSTGPRITGRIGDAFEVQGEGHYTIANYSGTTVDSDTVGGVVAFGRRMSERSFIGIGASYDEVNYDEQSSQLTPDFERREYFLRFRTQGSRTTLEADVGYAEVTGPNIDDSAPLARISLTRRLTPYVSGFVAYTREFPTSNQAAFTPAPVDDTVVGDASVLTPGPRETESAQIGLSLNRPRTAARLAISHRDESALVTGSTTASERDINDISVSVSRLITNRSTVSGFGLYSKETIDTGSVDVDSDETIIGAQLSLAFGRALSLDFTVQHRSRDSDLAASDFDELSAGVYLRYGSARRLGTEVAGLAAP